MKFCKIDKELFNSVLVGLTFMFLYTAFYTLSNFEKLILYSIHNENPEYSGDGFISLSVLYISFAVFMWFVPPVISATGSKCSLTMGAVGFSLFLASFLPERGWVLYLGSVCNGIGAAMISISQGVYLILNSTEETITRNSAIFTGIWQSSMIYGNLFVYFMFAGKTTIDKATRSLVISVLLALTIAAVIIASMLPPPAHAAERSAPLGGAVQALRKSWSITITKYMLILCPMYLYCGLQLSYLSGIFGAAVGFTTYSDGFPSNQLVAVTGFFTGIGEILAGVFLVIINPLLSGRPWMRSLIVALGVLTDCIGFLLSYLNYSNNSIFSPTAEPAIITSRSWIAIVIAVLLGFCDGIYTPMLISLVGKICPSGSASDLTIYAFCFSLGSAISFFYSAYIGLHWQLLILAGGGIFGASCYFYVNKDIWNK